MLLSIIITCGSGKFNSGGWIQIKSKKQGFGAEAACDFYHQLRLPESKILSVKLAKPQSRSALLVHKYYSLFLCISSI